MAGRTVAIQFVRAAMETAQAHGLDLRQALREAGISAELLARDAARVTPDQATQLVQALWEAADDELLGVGPNPIPRGTFRMITLGLIHSRDLRTALRRLVEFSSIAMSFDAIAMQEDGQAVRLCFDPGGHTLTDPLAVDILMAVVHRFAGWLIGRRIALSAVDLPWPAPAHAAEYPLIYGITPTFDASAAAIAFDARYLSSPVVRTEDELTEFIRNSPSDLIFREDYHPTAASRVRRVIERGRESVATVTVDDVAGRLNISAQHVRRLLREEGTSFREIREEILRDEAIATLVRGGETVEEISDRLGFSEPSAFRRAFRRWTGSPPGSYRPAGDRESED